MYDHFKNGLDYPGEKHVCAEALLQIQEQASYLPGRSAVFILNNPANRLEQSIREGTLPGEGTRVDTGLDVSLPDFPL